AASRALGRDELSGPDESRMRAVLRRRAERSGPALESLSVMHLASGDLWAGAEVQLYNLVRELHVRSDIDLKVVLFNHGVLEERLREAGVPTTVFDETTLGSPHLLWLLAKFMRRHRPDVLHTHRIKENVLGTLASLVCPGTRSIRTIHGAPEHGTSALQLRKSIPVLLDWLCARYLQQKIVCVSDHLRAIFDPSIPDQKLAVVNNGIGIELVERAAGKDIVLPGARDSLRVAFVGRLAPVKRPDLFLEITKETRKVCPGRVSFYIIGDGPLHEPICEFIRTNRLAGSVHLLGFLPEVAPYLARMDLLLITSDYEGLPMSLLEAMCVRLPVVSHAVGAIPTVLGDGEFGFLVRTQKPQDYAKLIQLRLASPSVFTRKADLAYRERLPVYSACSMATAYVDLYRQVAGACA
ncbi:MAG: glycosyltransferase, partial [Chromatiales bacterium]